MAKVSVVVHRTLVSMKHRHTKCGTVTKCGTKGAKCGTWTKCLIRELPEDRCLVVCEGDSIESVQDTLRSVAARPKASACASAVVLEQRNVQKKKKKPLRDSRGDFEIRSVPYSHPAWSEHGTSRGLFATSDVPRGAIVAEYEGMLVCEHEASVSALSMYEIAVELGGQTLVLETSALANPAAMVNDAMGTGSRENCRMHVTVSNAQLHVYLVATRIIREGQEALVAYGDPYWQQKRKNDRESAQQRKALDVWACDELEVAKKSMKFRRLVDL